MLKWIVALILTNLASFGIGGAVMMARLSAEKPRECRFLEPVRPVFIYREQERGTQREYQNIKPSEVHTLIEQLVDVRKFELKEVVVTDGDDRTIRYYLEDDNDCFAKYHKKLSMPGTGIFWVSMPDIEKHTYNI